MNIGIITLHRVRNYGSVLQAYALCQILKANGMEPRIIDYVPERFRLRTDLFYVRKDRYTGKNGRANHIKKLILISLSILPRFYYYTRFSRFVDKYIPVTEKKYYTNSQLKQSNLDFDIYMNGSDQVWNMSWEHNVDKAFFLDFVPQNKRKVAYAASFGKSKLDTDEAKVIKPMLEQYDFISVREDSGLDILESLGIKGGVHVLDPTLLYDKFSWMSLAGKRRIQKKYLLVYQLNYKTKALHLARSIADQLGLVVVDLSRKIKKDNLADINVPFATPEVFLNSFAYADFIVTDSFHGTAFSINMNKQFVSIRNDFPERVGSLIRLMGIESRFISIGEKIERNELLKPIEYSSVNAILKKERIKAIKIILENIINR